MKVDLPQVFSRTMDVNDYVDSIQEPFRQKFHAIRQNYVPDAFALKSLKKAANDYVIIVFSAAWCKDCIANVPVLATISQITGMQIRVFGGIKKDPLSRECKWRIPPSPPEIQTLKIDSLPTIVILDKEGNQVGRIIENPKNAPTLEQEINQIISQCSTKNQRTVDSRIRTSG